MKQEHTKTPWHLVTQSPDDEGLVRMAVRVPGPQPTGTEYGICTIDGHGSMEHDAREVADAELIVRAVNSHARMVEALESVVRSHMDPFEDHAQLAQRINAAVENAIAAIRAARGEA